MWNKIKYILLKYLFYKLKDYLLCSKKKTGVIPYDRFLICKSLGDKHSHLAYDDNDKTLCGRKIDYVTSLNVSQDRLRSGDICRRCLQLAHCHSDN